MNDPLWNAIFSRVSTRSFDAGALDGRMREVLLAAMKRYEGEGPFGAKVRFALVEGEGSGRPARMGTYGLISGASAYLAAVVTRGPGAMEDLGRAAEGVVLEATAAGLSSCWIGGVFNRARAGLTAAARPDEIVPAVIALGMQARRRSIADRVVTGAARARTRKAADELFFSVAPGGELAACDRDCFPEAGPEAAPQAWENILEAVRIAPSASNKQPWRLITFPRVTGPGGWLFCMAEDKVYNSALGEAKMQDIDMGIAMRHFEEACRVFGVSGHWIVPDDAGAAAAVFTATTALVAPAAAAAKSRGWTPIVAWIPR